MLPAGGACRAQWNSLADVAAALQHKLRPEPRTGISVCEPVSRFAGLASKVSWSPSASINPRVEGGNDPGPSRRFFGKMIKGPNAEVGPRSFHSTVRP